jgi:hypothetical protein
MIAQMADPQVIPLPPSISYHYPFVTVRLISNRAEYKCVPSSSTWMA